MLEFLDPVTAYESGLRPITSIRWREWMSSSNNIISIYNHGLYIDNELILRFTHEPIAIKKGPWLKVSSIDVLCENGRVYRISCKYNSYNIGEKDAYGDHITPKVLSLTYQGNWIDFLTSLNEFFEVSLID